MIAIFNRFGLFPNKGYMGNFFSSGSNQTKFRICIAYNILRSLWMFQIYLAISISLKNYIVNIKKSIVVFVVYSDSFLLTTTLIYNCRLGCNEYAYNVDIKLIPFQISLIHKPVYSFGLITLEKYFDWLELLIKIYSLSCCIYKESKQSKFATI